MKVATCISQYSHGDGGPKQQAPTVRVILVHGRSRTEEYKAAPKEFTQFLHFQTKGHYDCERHNVWNSVCSQHGVVSGDSEHRKPAHDRLRQYQNSHDIRPCYHVKVLPCMGYQPEQHHRRGDIWYLQLFCQCGEWFPFDVHFDYQQPLVDKRGEVVEDLETHKQCTFARKNSRANSCTGWSNTVCALTWARCDGVSVPGVARAQVFSHPSHMMVGTSRL